MKELSKEEALIALTEGKKIAHLYYTDDEYLVMDSNSNIIDECGYNMGNPSGEFWQTIQKWEFGWIIRQ